MLAGLIFCGPGIAQTERYWEMVPNSLMAYAPGINWPEGSFNMLGTLDPADLKEFDQMVDWGVLGDVSTELKWKLWRHSAYLGWIEAATGLRQVKYIRRVKGQRGYLESTIYVLSRRHCSPRELLAPLIVERGSAQFPRKLEVHPGLRILYKNCVLSGSRAVQQDPDLELRAQVGGVMPPRHLLEQPRIEWK